MLLIPVSLFGSSLNYTGILVFPVAVKLDRPPVHCSVHSTCVTDNCTNCQFTVCDTASIFYQHFQVLCSLY